MNRTISLVAIVLGLAVAACAQESRGTIQGTVKDPQGALVAGASVVVTETATKTAVSLKTNEAGRYIAPLLMPGDYSVTAEAKGFKKAIRDNVALLTGDVRTVDIELQVGSATESVTVSEEAPIIDVTNTSTAKALDDRTVRDLPVMTDVVTSMIQYTPGVNAGGSASGIIGPHSTQGGSDYNNGSGVGGNVWTIDGAFSNGNARTTSNLPAVNSVAEMEIVGNTFDGSFGHSLGLGITITTKGGANDFHGDANENYWAQRWWGSNLFTKQAYYTKIDGLMAQGNTAAAAAAAKLPIQPGGHSNLFGFNATGPLRIPHLIDLRNKVFWSLTYVGERDHKTEDPSVYARVVPSAAEKTGNFSDLYNVSDGLNYQLYDPLSVKVDPTRTGTHYVRTPLPGNILPASYAAMGAPYYKNYTKYWPDPNNWGNMSLAQNAGATDYLATSTPYNWDFNQWQGRMDMNLTSKARVFGRFTRNHFVEYRSDWTYFIVPFYNNQGPQGTGVTRDDQNGVLDFVYTVNSSTLFHASGSVSNWMSYSTTGGYPFQFKPSNAGMPAYMDSYCGNWCYLPTMSIGGNGTATNNYAINGIGGTIAPNYNRFYDYNADVYHNRGNHQFRAGADFRQQTRVVHNGNSDGGATFGNNYFRQYDDSGPNGTYNPATLGLSWASFMMGLPTSESVTNNASYTVSNQYAAFFLQDTWRVKPKLTLTLSLRAEWENGAKGHQNDYVVSWNPTAQLPISSAAQAAYAANTASQVPELAASSFVVQGGAIYAGTPGAPSRMWDSELTWLPRIGFGYQLDKKTVLRGGYGIYYDTLDVNASSFSLNQSGASTSTGTTFTTTNGVNWGSNGTNCGSWCNLGTTMTSPLSDPFPVRGDGTRFNLPVGNVYGLMGLLALNNGPTSWTVPDSSHPRMQRWRMTIERQLTSHDVVSFGYTGAYTSKLNINVNKSALPASYYYTGLSRPVNSTGSTISCASGVTNATANGCLEDTNLGANVSNPFYIGNLSSLQSSNPTLYNAISSVGSFFTSTTISKANLLKPYPSSNLTVGMPLGYQRETSFDASINHRFGRGLVANFGYTYFDSRYATSFLQSWNPFDSSNPQSPIWQPNNINPHRFTFSFVYDLPFGKGRRWVHEKYLDAVVGGWILSSNYVWSMGTLISMPNAFYYGDPKNIKLSHPTLGEWFNTAGCVLPGATMGPGDTAVSAGQPCTSGWDKRSSTQPGTYQTRVMPLYEDGVRGPSWGQLNSSLARDFKFNIGEHALTFEARADVLNVMNHSYFGGPGTTVTSGVGSFGAITAGSSMLNRFIQIQGHIRW
jgi:hypothetical protein